MRGFPGARWRDFGRGLLTKGRRLRPRPVKARDQLVQETPHEGASFHPGLWLRLFGRTRW